MGVEKDPVIIVGAGLVGLAAALELCERGHPVELLERAVPGAEASTAAAGILGPQLEHEVDGPTLALALAGAAATRALVARLAARGVDVDLVAAPAVKLATTTAEVEALERRVAWQKARGLAAELVDEVEAHGRDPALGACLRAAFFPDDHCLDPRRYGEALQAWVRALPGVRLSSGVPVKEILVEGGRCRGVRLDDGRALRAPTVVVCGGAWSLRVPGVAAALGLSPERAAALLRPVRGQMVELRGAPGVVSRVVYGPGGYVVPRGDGRVVCGSTMEDVGFDKSVTAAGVASILERSLRAVPALGGFALGATWAGLRPAPLDGLPFLGESALSGLWLSTGHFRNGVLLAAVSAQALGALLDGDPPSVDVAPFSPKRLASLA
jgi:glycine oxidase